MKIIITHTSPDWDAITSAWLIKRFLPGWEEASIQFVPAGQRVAPFKGENAIESIQSNEVVHVDTGLGPLDHHQTSSKSVCGASLSWDFVQKNSTDLSQDRKEAIGRMVGVVTQIDHFQEVFYPDAAADYQEFSLFGLLEGLKFEYPDQDDRYMENGLSWLDAMLHNFENRIWAEKEMKEKGKEFETRFGKGIAVETINGVIPKLGQKLGYVLVVRKDPRKGNVQIKARPDQGDQKTIDLTLVYEQLRKMDPNATWFLHVSKKMLLNGSMKNPTMVPTVLTLDQVVKVAQKV